QGVTPQVGTERTTHTVHSVTLHTSLGPKDPCASKRMLGHADGRLGHGLTIGANEDGERHYTSHHAMHPPVSSLLAGKSDPPAEYYCPNALRYSSTCFCSSADCFFANPGILPFPSAMMCNISTSSFCFRAAPVTGGISTCKALASWGLPAPSGPWQV